MKIINYQYQKKQVKIMRNQLHWLDITARKYKMCMFAFRCLQNIAPRYLSDYCIPVATSPGRSHLRSAASATCLCQHVGQ